MNIKIKSFSFVVGLVSCAFVNAAEFEAAVWRGETAYVEIPKELLNLYVLSDHKLQVFDRIYRHF